jgi:hypothetical protein
MIQKINNIVKEVLIFIKIIKKESRVTKDPHKSKVKPSLVSNKS